MSFKCVHLSDIHWRGLTRHNEYRESFSKMFEKVRELEPDAIFIGGDIVHSKTQGISPELIDCLSWWFTQMADICPTHVILGNHDGLILNKHRQDAISPIVSALDNDNLFLYKDSGTYPTGIPGFNWCVFSCFDEEKWKSVKPVKDEINIATFHGGVWGSLTDIDWEIEGDVELEFFSDYEFAFLGDIHKLQYLDSEKRVAYPGSTIQQNYGEDPGKGFLFWEIEDKDNFKSTFYEIPHSKPFVTVEWAGSVSDTLRRCNKYPDQARFRIRTDTPISNAEIKHLHSELKETKSATEIVFKYDQHHDLGTISLPEGEYKTEDLRTLATHVDLMKDYYAHLDMTENEWKRLEVLIQKYFNLAVRSDCVRNVKWSVKRLEFDNIFSYGRGNIVNFENLKGITGIFGRNRAGKSSIPGSLMFGLYNTTDRGAMSNLHVINMRKGHCVAKIDLSANGKNYHIERQAVKKTSSRGKESAVTHLNFSLVDPSGNVIKDLNGEQRRETEKVVRSIVGTPDDFLLTSLASQGAMNTFIKHRATQRKNILTKFLDLEIFDEMLALAKADSSDIKGMLSNVPDRDWNVLIESFKREKREIQKERKSTEQELEMLRMKLQQAQIALATTDDSSLVTQEDVDEKTHSLAETKLKLDKIVELHSQLISEARSIEEKIKTISDVKSQFPIDDLREQHEAHQDLEKSLLQLKHVHETEKIKLKNQKKSIKILEEVPCGDSYPTCKFIKNSHVNKKNLEKQEGLVQEALDQVRAAKKSLAVLAKRNLNEKIEKYNQILERERDLQLDVSSKQLQITKSANKKKALTDLIKDLEQELNSMKLRVSNTEEAERISLAKKMIAQIKEKINASDAERLKHTEMIGHLDAKIDNTKVEKEKYSQLIGEWKTYELFMNAVSKKGIPLKIMSCQLPVINEEIGKILQGVVGFTVELESEENSNDMDIYINYGDSKRIIECGSGMEKMMASLAIRVALINITSLPKSDMLIIDEGFGALDEMNVESCTRLLESLKRWFKNIIVISHVDAVKDAVDNVLDITQVEKNAKVVYE